MSRRTLLCSGILFVVALSAILVTTGVFDSGEIATLTVEPARQFPTSTLHFRYENVGADPSPNSRITNVQFIDLDNDGRRDILACDSRLDRVLWYRRHDECSVPGSASVVWLENDGEENFRTWQIADRPIRLITVDCGDLDGDGRDEIVAGGLRFMPPHDRLGRVALWWNRGTGGASESSPGFDSDSLPAKQLDPITARELEALRNNPSTTPFEIADAYAAFGVFSVAEEYYREAAKTAVRPRTHPPSGADAAS
jgi:hypothetical protein